MPQRQNLERGVQGASAAESFVGVEASVAGLTRPRLDNVFGSRGAWTPTFGATSAQKRRPASKSRPRLRLLRPSDPPTPRERRNLRLGLNVARKGWAPSSLHASRPKLEVAGVCLQGKGAGGRLDPSRGPHARPRVQNTAAKLRYDAVRRDLVSHTACKEQRATTVGTSFGIMKHASSSSSSSSFVYLYVSFA